MNYLWLLLAVWAAILTVFVAVIVYDEVRYRWRQHRRGNVVDFTRRKVG